MEQKPYFLVTFEGPAGSGKSYHGLRFKKYLENKTGEKVAYVANPYRLSTIGNNSYNLLTNTNSDFTSEEFALLALLNKNSLHQYIKQLVNEGYKYIVVDRWNLSFFCHQIIASGLIHSNPVFSSWALQYPDEIIPDLQFLLTVDNEELQKRIKERNPSHKLNRYETEKFAPLVRAAYIEYLKNNRDYKAIVVKGNEDKDIVFNRIVSIFEKSIDDVR